ncbi:MAG: hypothetical protein GQ569_05295 [Methylococcaceae bacterium]|nr:hypothetical protein [Methylococcaceae bacterium]
MQAIEFEAHLKNGMIQLPNLYNHWHEGKKVKVIVLDNEEEKSDLQPTTQNINRHAGKITLTQDPLEYQAAMRDEWA